ncbi:MAG: ASKHA domain-containing protein [Dehalococcoidia bacterium]|jgi:uncharacterized 2Fe-2S/4Fe-4S cluster protein (DUF4445 family)
MSKEHTVIFQPSGRSGLVAAGQSLKEASVRLGVDIEGGCGAQATCGQCLVRVVSGSFDKYGISSGTDSLSPLAESERQFISPAEEAEGYRLACQAKICGDVVVFVPEASRLGKQVVRKDAGDIAIAINPAVKLYYLELPPASLEDNEADWERLQRGLEAEYGLKNLTIDSPALAALPPLLRESDWKLTAFVRQGQEVIRVAPGKVAKAYGLAVDIGTTTVAGYLCDLADGSVASTVSMMNPQVVYGEDVMSRISYIMTNDDGLETLKRTITQGLNQLVKDACSSAGIRPEDIVDMTVVGNTCMHHVFLGIDPQFIGKAPFVPALRGPLDVKARDLGINIAGGTYVHVLPIEAGFVGADNVAVLLAAEPQNRDELELIIDIGTNGELVMGNREHLIACSCATGPALEGAEIKHGMRAVPGAIERIAIDRETKEARFKVIGEDSWSPDKKDLGAKGICGSAIIDILPQLFGAGIIDKTGRFAAELDSPRFRVVGDVAEFVIAWAEETSIGRDITIGQKDVRAIQLAKAAMYAGAKLMMQKLGVGKIDRVKLAGAFGSYIDPLSAARLGLFPDCDLKAVSAIGNAAGDGARAALLDIEKRRQAEAISRRVDYLELTRAPGFERLFAEAMWLPHMKDDFPHLG